jgi:hypothetical protein
MKIFLLTLFVLGLTAISCIASESTPVPTKHFDRVIQIVLENSDYSQSLANPYLHELAKRGTLFTNFHALTHPSYPNYLAMVGGETFHVSDDGQITIDQRSVADLFDAKNLQWRNYADDYPGNCFLGNKYKRYARKHVPFVSFKNIQSNPKECAKIESSTDFLHDWTTGHLPEYSFFSPDLDHDGHDTSVLASTQWLKPFLETLLKDPVRMKGTLIIITYDEAGAEPTNQIYTLFLGPVVKSNFEYHAKTSPYDVLRTIEDNFDLGTLGKGGSRAHAIETVWN